MDTAPELLARRPNELWMELSHYARAIAKEGPLDEILAEIRELINSSEWRFDLNEKRGGGGNPGKRVSL